ncbi:acyclic terpene utilization AtuA family protein [Pseudonocardia pini]
MVEGGPIDVLCGDYLAELTMLILAKAQAKDPAAGYARTFLTQMQDVLGLCVERGTKVVSNAGGLNPAGLAAAIDALGTGARVAWVEGDDLRGSLGAITPPVEGKPVSANAYLGGWGIAEALAAGADVVVTGRVTDASLVVGPAAWWHGWTRGDFDALAGAVAAGHVIECGPQACGGNYSFLAEVTDRRYPGFPIAEVAADGSSVITKHPGTGGLVSVGTVTAQLLYEIAGPAYLGPDCTTHFDTITLTQEGPDRVLVSGVRGSAPPPTLKVALNDAGGYRNSMTLVLTGLDIEAKAAWAEEMLFDVLGGRDRFASVDVRLLRFDRPDAPSNEQATAHLRVTVKDPDPRTVGRAFSNATMELALGGYAGFHTTTPPTAESAYGVYRPAAVPRSAVTQTVVLPDGTRSVVADPQVGEVSEHLCPARSPAGAGAAGADPHAGGQGKGVADPHAGGQSNSAADPHAGGQGKGVAGEDPGVPAEGTRPVPLGAVCGARSGDKGGNANVGVWTRTEAEYAWLRGFLTVDRARELLGPEVADLEIEVFPLPNLKALNVVVHGILGEGVASSTRPDPQAKGLGEYLRSRVVEVPTALLEG